MKKAVRIIVILCIAIIIFSFYYPIYKSHHYGTSEYNYPCTWVCEDPEIVIEYTKGGGMICHFSTDEGTIDCLFGTRSPETFVRFVSLDDDLFYGTVLSGDIDYSPKKWTVYVKEDNLYGGKYEKLVFVRQEDEASK